MKTYSFLAGICLIILTSCSTSKDSATLKASRDNLKGTWEITDIQTNLPTGMAVTNVFDEAAPSEFENSIWELVRNGNGTYTLSNGKTQTIYWSSSGKSGAGQFRFKKISEGEKPSDVTAGYVLNLYNLTPDSFSAASNITFADGQVGTITYTFSKR